MTLASSAKRPIRFAFVGILNTLVDIGIYTVLVLAGWQMVVANVLSTSCGMLLSFTLNRNFTFEAQAGKRRRQIVLFLAVTLTSQWLLQPIVITLADSLLRSISIRGALLVVLAKICGIGISLIWNYILYSKYVFTSPQNNLGSQ